MNDIVDAEVIDAVDEVEKSSTTVSVAKFVVRSSVKFVIAGAITALVPEPETKVQKIKLAVGSYVIADMVSKSTGTYVEEKIDGWKKDIQEVRAVIKQLESKKTNP